MTMELEELKVLWNHALAASPPRLEHYQKLTVELVKIWRSGNPDAIERIKREHHRLRKLPDSEIGRGDFDLDAAQFLVARSLRFESWPEFAKYLEADNPDQNYLLFRYAVQSLEAGDFSRIESVFDKPALGRAQCHIVEWYEARYFDKEPMALAEALTCACMLGKTSVAEYLLDKGVDPAAGNNTGLNGFHYAASSGHLDTVRLLIERKAPLELKNMYGGTVLDQAVWSATNETQVEHLHIIEELINAGARVDAVRYPTGNGDVDEVLIQHGPKADDPAADGIEATE